MNSFLSLALERALPPASCLPGDAADQLCVVEIVLNMAAYFRQALPGVNVTEGETPRLRDLLPYRRHGRMWHSSCTATEIRAALIDRPMEAVAPGQGFPHYSYCATLPLHARHHGLVVKREA